MDLLMTNNKNGFLDKSRKNCRRDFCAGFFFEFFASFFHWIPLLNVSRGLFSRRVWSVTEKDYLLLIRDSSPSMPSSLFPWISTRIGLTFFISDSHPRVTRKTFLHFRLILVLNSTENSFKVLSLFSASLSFWNSLKTSEEETGGGSVYLSCKERGRREVKENQTEVWTRRTRVVSCFCQESWRRFKNKKQEKQEAMKCNSMM